jgi:hypothetical protein
LDDHEYKYKHLGVNKDGQIGTIENLTYEIVFGELDESGVCRKVVGW